MIRVKRHTFVDGLAFQLFDESPSEPIDIFLIILISLNVLAVILGSVHSIYQSWKDWLDLFEKISITIFAIEYFVRMLLCTKVKKFSSPLWGRIKYILTPIALIDLLAILPSLISFSIPAITLDLRFLRVLRLFRVFRIMKAGRYSNSLQTVTRVVKSRKEELLSILFVDFILLVIGSSILYYAEGTAQPDKFGSIPDSMWWGVVTLTTVGYGDIYPITTIGKILGAVIALLGIGLFALPAGILGGAFVEELRKNPKEMVCTHCGKKVDRSSEH